MNRDRWEQPLDPPEPKDEPDEEHEHGPCPDDAREEMISRRMETEEER